MKRLIATNRPINHLGQSLQKSDRSLDDLVSLKSIDLVDNHDGPVIGKIKDLYKVVKNNIVEVWGEIDATLNDINKGFSLEFFGDVLDGFINVSEFVHVAITENPRDSYTFSESQTRSKFSESEDVKPDTETKELEIKTVEDKKPEPETKEIVLDQDTLGQLVDAILADPTLKQKLMDSLPKVEPEPITEPILPVQQQTRIIIKPTTVAREEPVTLRKNPDKPKQQSFPAL